MGALQHTFVAAAYKNYKKKKGVAIFIDVTIKLGKYIHMPAPFPAHLPSAKIQGTLFMNYSMRENKRVYVEFFADDLILEGDFFLHRDLKNPKTIHFELDGALTKQT